jgi:hypothetical protein
MIQHGACASSFTVMHVLNTAGCRLKGPGISSVYGPQSVSDAACTDESLAGRVRCCGFVQAIVETVAFWHARTV